MWLAYFPFYMFYLNDFFAQLGSTFKISTLANQDTLIPNSTNSKIKDSAQPKKKVISISKVGLTKSSDSYAINDTNILVDKSKSYQLHDVDILGDKSKEIPSIHTLDTLLALADEN